MSTLTERCIEFLLPIAEPSINEEDDVYWIDARNIDVDQSASYCHKHAIAKRDELNAANPDGDHLVCKGYGSYESDSQEYCETCGVFLQTVLTQDAVDAELEHFEMYRISLRGKHRAGEAYAIKLLLEQARHFTERNIPSRVHSLAKRIDAMRRRRASGTRPDSKRCQ